MPSTAVAVAAADRVDDEAAAVDSRHQKSFAVAVEALQASNRVRIKAAEVSSPSQRKY